MRNFEYINREYVNPSNLNILGQTFNTLEQGHQKAVAAASELETAMANLDLNEAESEWRQQKINEIRNTIEENTIYGNAYSALDDIVAKAGNIASDAGMIGRLQAQKDYKAYLDNLNKRTDISEADKEYFREVNQYYYQDKYNNKGQIVSGTKWTPIDQEVAAPPMTQMMSIALKIAAKDAGGGNNIYYKDAAGNYTTNANLSVDGLPYINKTGKYERLTQDKIKSAMNAVIANTPGAAEGIAQDYKIAKWRHNKNSNNGQKVIVDETTDAKGLPLNQEQYLEKRLTGFYQSASYNHYYENIEPLVGMSVSAKNSKLKATQGGNTDILSAIYNANNTTPGGYYVKRNSSLSSSIAEYKAATSMLSGEAKRLGIQFQPNDVAGSYNEIKNYYEQKGQIVPKAIYDTYNAYLKGIEKYNQLIPKGTDTDIKQYLELVSALENGIDTALYNDNQYINKYNNLLANAYKDTEELALYFNDFDSATKNINYRSYGLVQKIDENGNKYLVLPKENSNNILFVSQAFEPYINKYNEQYSSGPNPVYYTKNNTARTFSDVLKLYNDVNNKLNSTIGDIDELIPLEVVSQMDVIQTLAENSITSGKYSDLKSATEDAKNRLNSSFQAAKGNELELYIGHDSDHAQFEINPDKRFKAFKAAQKIQSLDPDLVTISYDKNTLKTVINVNIDKKANDDNTIKSYLRDAGIDNYSYTIVADGLFNNEDKNLLMQLPDFRNNVEFTEMTSAGMTKFNNQDGSITHRIDKDHYALERDGLFIPIDKKEAVNIYGANDLFNNIKYQYLNIYNTYKGNIPQEYIQYLGNQILELVKLYSPKDKDIENATDLSNDGKDLYKQLETLIIE